MIQVTKGERSIFLKPKEIKCIITPMKKHCDISITVDRTTEKRSYEEFPDPLLIEKIKEISFDNIESTCNLVRRKKTSYPVQFDRYETSHNNVIFYLDDKRVGTIKYSRDEDSYIISFKKRSLSIKRSYNHVDVNISYTENNSDFVIKRSYRFSSNITIERLTLFVEKFPSFKLPDVESYLGLIK